MHDAIQADFACQPSSPVLPGGGTLPRLITPRNPQPATSLECPVTTGPVPAGAHGAHFLMRPWNAMLILGTIRSFRSSGFNLFCKLQFWRSVLPKRFGLWMLQDFARFLFRLRNAGAYIPFWDTLYAPRFYKFTYARISRSSEPKSHFKKFLEDSLYRTA